MTSDYGFSLTTFSSSGKLVQIEYALNAINLHGRPAIGIKVNDGCLICVDKNFSSTLIDETSIYKIEQLTESIGCTYAGMSADFRVLLARARKTAILYEKQYGSKITVSQLAKEIANIMQEYTQSGGVRPFGCSLLLCGYQEDNYQLFQIDPSGSYFSWKATTIGKDSENARMFLERRYKENMSIEDAINVALLTLRELSETQITTETIEIAVCQDKKFTCLRKQEIAAYLKDVQN